MNCKDNKCPNRAIECSVKQCEYNCESENYCSLDTVRIATHEPNPTVTECVDCESFVVKSQNQSNSTSSNSNSTNSNS